MGGLVFILIAFAIVAGGYGRPVVFSAVAISIVMWFVMKPSPAEQANINLAVANFEACIVVAEGDTALLYQSFSMPGLRKMERNRSSACQDMGIMESDPYSKTGAGREPYRAWPN